MALYGISDLHLSETSDKPMDVFGEHWRDHAARMAAAWDASVGPDDVVLCPGDLSWAMRLDEAAADLSWIGARPGRKILVRGNHDYWWSSLSKVRAAIPVGATALQNDAVELDGLVFAGSRLWALPGTPEFGADDEKILRRETGRLELSLQAARRLAGDTRPIVAAVHYPPFAPDGGPTAFSELLASHGVTLCVYGHLHGAGAHRAAVEGEVDGVRYALIAADYLDFAPRALDALLG